MPIKALATDLDGTLIPLDDHPQNQADLRTVASILDQHDLSLIFVTGRHFESVQQAMQQYDLPRPDWIICDVGATIMQRGEQNEFEAVADFANHMEELVADWSAPRVISVLANQASLRLQESEKRGPFKVSYYTDALQLQTTTTQLAEQLRRDDVPWSIISSVDPFNGDGLIDLLPSGVSKSYAINWWAAEHDLKAEQLVFAGDSGNDIAALTAGYKAIVVGNAAADVISETRTSHRIAAWADRLFVSQHSATSGVADGLHHYLRSAAVRLRPDSRTEG